MLNTVLEHSNLLRNKKKINKYKNSSLHNNIYYYTYRVARKYFIKQADNLPAKELHKALCKLIL